jgi:hypothetical protein
MVRVEPGTFEVVVWNVAGGGGVDEHSTHVSEIFPIDDLSRDGIRLVHSMDYASTKKEADQQIYGKIEGMEWNGEDGKESKKLTRTSDPGCLRWAVSGFRQG